MSPYYTTLGCTWTHYLVRTDPMLHGPLTNSGCTYTSYFTSAVTPEVNAEQSSNLRVEQSSEMGVEWSSNSKSGVEQSSDLGVGWKLEQQKWEMGHPLTAHLYSIAAGPTLGLLFNPSPHPLPSIFPSLATLQISCMVSSVVNKANNSMHVHPGTNGIRTPMQCTARSFSLG